MFAEWKLFIVVSPYPRELTTFLDSGFQILVQCLCRELGFWIPVVGRISDTLSCIPDSKAQDPGFHKEKISRIPWQGQEVVILWNLPQKQSSWRKPWNEFVALDIKCEGYFKWVALEFVYLHFTRKSLLKLICTTTEQHFFELPLPSSFGRIFVFCWCLATLML